jgi:hypothetical protein
MSTALMPEEAKHFKLNRLSFVAVKLTSVQATEQVNDDKYIQTADKYIQIGLSSFFRFMPESDK